MLAVIMAGGTGTRLWPSSRNNFPKQFLSLIADESFIQMTARRLSLACGSDNVFVVAGEHYKFSIVDQLSGTFGKPFENLILEPFGRNIALTVKYLIEKQGVSDDEVVLFAPSDHLFAPVEKFVESVKAASEAAGDSILTFGIVPRRPDTGYGYVEIGDRVKGDVHRVKRFVEKPDLATAESYLSAGNYMWNSGMFLFKVKTIKEAFRHHVPDLYEAIEKMTFEEMAAGYESFPSISIDYAVMEKVSGMLCSKLALDWNDIGSWESIYEALPKGDRGNAVKGNVELYDVENSLILSEANLTTAIGVRDLVIVDTGDAVLVCDRSKAQNVRELVEQMKKNKRREVAEHLTTYRPWGSYTILEEGHRYKIKRIVVNPGANLSLQRHRHRSEHWVVVRGMAEVRIGEETTTLHENQSVYVPIFETHRLANPGKIPLEIIEVQNGAYVGEDDIERIEDVYGRK